MYTHYQEVYQASTYIHVYMYTCMYVLHNTFYTWSFTCMYITWYMYTTCVHTHMVYIHVYIHYMYMKLHIICEASCGTCNICTQLQYAYLYRDTCSREHQIWDLVTFDGAKSWYFGMHTNHLPANYAPICMVCCMVCTRYTISHELSSYPINSLAGRSICVKICSYMYLTFIDSWSTVGGSTCSTCKRI